MKNEQQQNEAIDQDLLETQGGGHGFVTLILIVLVIFVLAGGGWYLYKTYRNKNYDEVVVVAADKDEIKAQPLDPGGMVVDNMDKDIYNTIDKNYKEKEKLEVLLPPAEEPVDKKELLIAQMSPPVKEMDEKPVEKPHPVPVVFTPLEMEIARQVTEKPKKHVVAPPAVQEEVKIDAPVHVAKDSEEFIKPVTVKTAKAKPGIVKKKDKFYKVQIASFKSTSDAEKEWKILSKKHPSLLGEYQRFIVSKDIEGKGLFYRLQVGPFDMENDAKKACSQFKNVGMNCFIIKP
jgi:cell division protein FtsN